MSGQDADLDSIRHRWRLRLDGTGEQRRRGKNGKKFRRHRLLQMFFFLATKIHPPDAVTPRRRGSRDSRLVAHPGFPHPRE
jgi:hypothetical protein